MTGRCGSIERSVRFYGRVERDKVPASQHSHRFFPTRSSRSELQTRAIIRLQRAVLKRVERTEVWSVGDKLEGQVADHRCPSRDGGLSLELIGLCRRKKARKQK